MISTKTGLQNVTNNIMTLGQCNEGAEAEVDATVQSIRIVKQLMRVATVVTTISSLEEITEADYQEVA